MKGLELSLRYWEEAAKPIFEKELAELMPYIATGLCGSGSECFGFDDELSTDHDFEPGFCIFIPSEDVLDSRSAFRLERAYAKLPDEFCGYKRQKVSPVGGNRHGVIETAVFFKSKVGSADAKLSIDDWFSVPDSFFAEAVNGKIFYDGYGEVTKIREKLSCMPNDVKLKKLAGNLITMASSGEYNYKRCISHNEKGSACLSVKEFVISALKVGYLLTNSYMPYYKWSFRALREKDGYCELVMLLEDMISNPLCERTEENIEKASGIIRDKLTEEGFIFAKDEKLDGIAYGINEIIEDNVLRTQSIFYAV